MSEFITRSEHNESTRRLHRRIDGIDKSSISIKISSENIEKSVNEMHSLFYGTDGRDGLLVKIATMFEKVSTNRRLIFLIIAPMLVAVIGATIFIIREALIK